jgi:hypothetical protein
MSQSSKVIKQAAVFEVPSVRDGAQKIKLVSPASFSTLGIDGVCNLTLPNGSVYKLPAGSIVKSAIVRATTNVAGNTLDLGLNATSETTDTTLLDGATVAQVNAGLYCGPVLATATPILASASDRYVVATAKVAANTAGAIEVILSVVKCDI